MSLKAWNWARILGNTLTTFALSAMGIKLAGLDSTALVAAFYIAGMTALLAFGKELQQEGENADNQTSPLKHVLLF